MKKRLTKELIITVIISVVVILAVLYVGRFVILKDNFNTTKEISGKANPMEFNNKFTIFFFHDGYKDKQSFSPNKTEATKAVNLFKATLELIEPFKSLSPVIETRIFTTGENECNVKMVSGKKRLMCNSRVFKAIDDLNISNYKIVVLSPLEFDTYSDYAKGKNSAIYISTYKGKLDPSQFKRWMGIIFSQELGHSLGLFYEYEKPIAKDLLEDSFGPPNCAPDLTSAKKWWGTSSTQFFRGCGGSNNYYYPEKGTLMSDLPSKESYGKISEDYLRGVLTCFYANQKSAILSTGEISCDTLKKEYPNFWKE